jgi:hypothetical protein
MCLLHASDSLNLQLSLKCSSYLTNPAIMCQKHFCQGCETTQWLPGSPNNNHLIGPLSDQCLGSHNQPQCGRGSVLSRSAASSELKASQNALHKPITTRLRFMLRNLQARMNFARIPSYCHLSPLSTQVPPGLLFLEKSCFQSLRSIYARRLHLFRFFLVSIVSVFETLSYKN